MAEADDAQLEISSVVSTAFAAGSVVFAPAVFALIELINPTIEGSYSIALTNK
jgi:hypothetical protein